jgi:hypothetical protein
MIRSATVAIQIGRNRAATTALATSEAYRFDPGDAA